MENLLVFDSTHQAMEMEEAVKKAGLKAARLIPTPEAISASCGLALKFAANDLPKIRQLVVDNLDVSPEQARYYQIVEVNRKKSYKEMVD